MVKIGTIGGYNAIYLSRFGVTGESMIHGGWYDEELCRFLVLAYPIQFLKLPYRSRNGNRCGGSTIRVRDSRERLERRLHTVRGSWPNDQYSVLSTLSYTRQLFHHYEIPPVLARRLYFRSRLRHTALKYSLLMTAAAVQLCIFPAAGRGRLHEYE